MKIIDAINYREIIITLLLCERLPTEDLPEPLENFRVMIDNDKPVGVVGLETHGNYGLLRSLVVRPGFRNQNIAAALIKEIEKLAVSKRLKSIFLLTETAPDYFLHKGYSRITRSEVPLDVQQSSEFSHVCPQSAIAMKKDIE